jgi:poly(3-hydroxybutyrate) depolymerase
MLYYLHELNRLSMAPARLGAEITKLLMTNPFNPVSQTYWGRTLGSAADVFELQTRRYGKPSWGLETVGIDGETVDVEIEELIHRTWCTLLHFDRKAERDDPRVLLVAPYSGHFATLLRGTVERLLPAHDVYVTDWADARMVRFGQDRFNFYDYVEYIVDFLHFLGPNTHVIAVCQPTVPVMAAVAQMSGWEDNCVPATMTLIGGPVDPRRSATAVNRLATDHQLDWFERNVIVQVPPPYPGMFRNVYPGFIQLTNFISMNLERHVEAQHELFQHLVEGDDDAADKKREFYEEFLAVLDLPAEFYLSTVRIVFQERLLPRGKLVVHWNPARPDRIRHTAILCIEGERDDISGVGQTRAALDITTNLPDNMKQYHLQKGAGHYGVFNGSKWRTGVAPVIERFIRKHDRGPKARRSARRARKAAH